MSVEETAKTYLGLPHIATGMKLYKNLGNGAFRDVTEEAKLDKVFQPMGAGFGMWTTMAISTSISAAAARLTLLWSQSSAAQSRWKVLRRYHRIFWYWRFAPRTRNCIRRPGQPRL